MDRQRAQFQTVSRLRSYIRSHGRRCPPVDVVMCVIGIAPLPYGRGRCYTLFDSVTAAVDVPYIGEALSKLTSDEQGCFVFKLHVYDHFMAENDVGVMPGAIVVVAGVTRLAEFRGVCFGTATIANVFNE